MLRSSLLFLLAFGLFSSCLATHVKECGSDKEVEDVNKYKISACDSPPCKLKKRTNITAEFSFVPSEDLEKLTNDVYAQISGVPFPFVGVHGKSACTQIEDLNGNKGCPLKKGQEYKYKNAFYIYDIYPKIPLNVQWALVNPGNKKKELCFTVEAKITS